MNHVRQFQRRAATVLRWRPDWPFVLVIGLAWVALLTGAVGHGDGDPASAGTPAVELPAHEHHQGHGLATPVADSSSRRDHQPGSLPAALGDWTVMSVAMMAPVALPAVQHVGLNSIRSRRRRAMSVFFALYVTTWVAFGLAALAAGRQAQQVIGLDRVLLALALAGAAGWQLTRAKRRALFRCRRTVPLPPLGLRADAACARFALQQGWACVTSCWALMLVMSLVRQSAVLWMISLTAFIVVEQLTWFGRRLLRLSALALALSAGLVALGVGHI